MAGNDSLGQRSSHDPNTLGFVSNYAGYFAAGFAALAAYANALENEVAAGLSHLGPASRLLGGISAAFDYKSYEVAGYTPAESVMLAVGSAYITMGVAEVVGTIAASAGAVALLGAAAPVIGVGVAFAIGYGINDIAHTIFNEKTKSLNDVIFGIDPSSAPPITGPAPQPIVSASPPSDVSKIPMPADVINDLRDPGHYPGYFDTKAPVAPVVPNRVPTPADAMSTAFGGGSFSGVNSGGGSGGGHYDGDPDAGGSSTGSGSSGSSGVGQSG